MGAFRAQARGMAEGLESELTLAADAMFPMPVLLAALKAFGAHYPTVPVRVYVETLGSAASMVLEGRCALGLLVDFGSESPLLHRVPLLAADLVPVALRAPELEREGRVRLPIFAATRADRVPGPAARWLIDHLVGATVALRDQNIAPTGVVSLPITGAAAGPENRGGSGRAGQPRSRAAGRGSVACDGRVRRGH